MTRSRANFLLLAAVALLAVACGKNEPPPAPADSTPPATMPPDVLPEVEPESTPSEMPATPGDFADGVAGGPDYWAVTGADDDYGVNLRAGPSGSADIVGALGNDDVVKNLGCEMQDGKKWCQVQTVGDMPATGWLPGEFLAESAAP
jgi:hypothetical protein